MAKILAIDSSSTFCTVTLLCESQRLSRRSEKPRQHAGEILPMVESLLLESGQKLESLDAVAIARGPGSFTGLRIGSAVAQGLAFGADIPVITVSTLALLAAEAAEAAEAAQLHGTGAMLVCTQAREAEYYWGIYVQKEGFPTLLGKEHVSAAAQIGLDEARHNAAAAGLPDSLSGMDWHGVGDAWREPENLMRDKDFSIAACWPEVTSSADRLAEIARLHYDRGQTMAPELALPVYLKDDLDYQKS